MPRTPAPPKQTVKGTHALLNCPVCSNDIVADTEAVVQFTTAVDFAAPGSVTVQAEPQLVRFNVSHQCDGPIEDDATPAGGAS